MKIYHVTYNDFMAARDRYAHHIEGGESFHADAREAWLAALDYAGVDINDAVQNLNTEELETLLDETIRRTGDAIRVDVVKVLVAENQPVEGLST